MYLSPDLDPAELAGRIVAAASRPPSGMLADLLAGEPVAVPAWVLRGHRFGDAAIRVGWLADCADVVVTPDDVISAA